MTPPILHIRDSLDMTGDDWIAYYSTPREHRQLLDAASSAAWVTPGDETPEPLTVICAWCGVILHQGPPDAETSHGICEPCNTDWLERANLT